VQSQCGFKRIEAASRQAPSLAAVRARA
jgi:hypothetical protein